MLGMTRDAQYITQVATYTQSGFNHSSAKADATKDADYEIQYSFRRSLLA